MVISITTAVPDAVARRGIENLAAHVEDEDGAPPLSDQALSRLGSPAVTHIVLRGSGPETDVAGPDSVAGYAQHADDSLELVAGAHAVDAVLDAALRPGPTVWTHGRRSRFVAPLRERGYLPQRELLQLRMPLDALPERPHPLPDGVHLRTFVPGSDDAAWLQVNARAFAHHPEQGDWTAADLSARLNAPWFDEAGFLLAERSGELVGFHWTKVHPDGAGEVYVLGVSPQEQGSGLGSALLDAGLQYLAGRHCAAVLLYVEANNAAARHVYERTGFAEHDRDVQWADPAS